MDEEPVWACDAIIESLNAVYGEECDCFELGGLRGSPGDMFVRFGADPNALPEDMFDDIDRSCVSPLDAVRVFYNPAQGGHWHYVSMGFCDLYSELESQQNLSGYGFELTMRVVKAADEQTPPLWPVQVFQTLASYVFSSGNIFEKNQHVPLGGPIHRHESVSVEGVAFALDPQLGALESESGSIEMLQLVGLTADEYEQMRRWQVSKFIDLLKEDNPLLIIDPCRQSLLERPEIVEAIEEGVRTDGSSVGAHYTDLLEVDRKGQGVVIKARAVSVIEILQAMQGRLPFGRYYKVFGPNNTLAVFQPGDVSGAQLDADGQVVLNLTADSISELLEILQPMRGIYTFKTIPNVQLVVVPTQIKDHKGNVVQVIG